MKIAFRAVRVVILGAAAGWSLGAQPPGAAPADEASQRLAPVERANGERLPVALIDIDAAWRPLLRTDSQQRRWEAEEWLSWGMLRDSDRGTAIVLGSGSLLMGDVTAIGAETIRIESPVFAAVELPRDQVPGILWRIPVDPAERDRWFARLLAEPEVQDTVWMVNGDRLAGRIEGESAPGGAGGGTTRLRVTPSGGRSPQEVPLESVVAIQLRGPSVRPRPRPPVAGLIGLSDGSRLTIRQMFPEGTRWRMLLDGGAVLLAEQEALWPAVIGAQRFGADITYLSDIETVGFKHIPYLSRSWGYGADRSVSGGLLRVQGRIYAKGLGMHATSRLAYDLDPSSRRFEAEVALDDAASGHGSVIFRVLVERTGGSSGADGWTVAYESPVVRRGDLPRPVAVDVTGGARIALIVDAADRGDEGDHADWLNARLVR